MKKFLNGIDQCQQCPVEYLHVSPDYSMRVHEDHLQISWLFGVQFLPDADQVSKFYPRGRITQISNKHAFTREHNPL